LGGERVVRGRRPTLGLSLIARDEERFLPGLLESIDGAFDQVALLDTGSTDRTVEIFTDWASRQSLPLGYAVANFDGSTISAQPATPRLPCSKPTGRPGLTAMT